MADTPEPKPVKKSPRSRKRLVAWGLVSVATLAGVIFAASALSAPKPSVPELPEVTVSPADQSRTDYQQALAALASGDTTEAVRLLERAVQRDPNNTAASKKLEDLRSAPLPDSGKPKQGQPKASKPASAPVAGDPPAAVPPGEDPFDKPIDDIGALLPASVPGFEAGMKTVAGTDAELPLDPESRALAARVSRLQLSVHDRGSRSAAEAYVRDHSEKLYGNDASTVDVNGVKARSGTNSGSLAAVIFSRGRFAFEVVVTSAGSDPAAVLDVALDAAKTFPAGL